MLVVPKAIQLNLVNYCHSGDHFDKNLMDRKAEVKAIIEEVISNMSDDEEVDEGDDEEGPEGEGSDGEDDG